MKNEKVYNWEMINSTLLELGWSTKKITNFLLHLKRVEEEELAEREKMERNEI